MAELALVARDNERPCGPQTLEQARELSLAEVDQLLDKVKYGSTSHEILWARRAELQTQAREAAAAAQTAEAERDAAIREARRWWARDLAKVASALGRGLVTLVRNFPRLVGAALRTALLWAPFATLFVLALRGTIDRGAVVAGFAALGAAIPFVFASSLLWTRRTHKEIEARGHTPPPPATLQKLACGYFNGESDNYSTANFGVALTAGALFCAFAGVVFATPLIAAVGGSSAWLAVYVVASVIAAFTWLAHNDT